MDHTPPIHEDAVAMAALKDMWIGPYVTHHLGKGRYAVCARPRGPADFIAHVIFEVFDHQARDINAWIEIFSQLEHWQEI